MAKVRAYAPEECQWYSAVCSICGEMISLSPATPANIEYIDWYARRHIENAGEDHLVDFVCRSAPAIDATRID